MTRTPKRLLTLAILVLGGLVLQAGAALACTEQCMHIDSDRPFCRQCVDTGVYTGITCQSIGACGCAFTQNTCGLSASGIKADVQQADLSFLEQEGAGRICPAGGGVAR
ncbi:MAG TPA: hypothetical protein VF173_13050 [Thermoanaerobaculia bacterium]|nr:hypothetical protein [Thermoanaerobaculia bacterium]